METHPFIGLDNYRRAFADELVGIGFRNTAFYVVVIVPSITILALSLAVLGNQVHRAGLASARFFYIPTITPIVVTSLLSVRL